MDNVRAADRTLNISEEVLGRVAALAAQDVKGVAHLEGERSLQNPSASPVVIRNLGGAISVEVNLIVENGVRAVVVAKEVQQAVKQGIQDMTGVTAVHVNVVVCGVEKDV